MFEKTNGKHHSLHKTFVWEKSTTPENYRTLIIQSKIPSKSMKRQHMLGIMKII